MTGYLDVYYQVILGRNARRKISHASHSEIYLIMLGLNTKVPFKSGGYKIIHTYCVSRVSVHGFYYTLGFARDTVF